MVDNPKLFMIISIAFLLSLSAIIFAGKTYQEKQREESSFSISLAGDNASTSDTTKTTSKTNTKSTTANSVTPKQTSPSNAVVPISKTDYVVSYKNNAFVPQTLIIKAGQSVRFLNESGGSIFIAAARSPNSSDLTEFNQGRSVGKGGYYDFTFNRKGVFVYYNQNDRTKTGVISVE